jgi:hypothetical protein
MKKHPGKVLDRFKEFDDELKEAADVIESHELFP